MSLVLLASAKMAAQPEAPAAIEVASYTITGTIESIDTDTRTVTIVGADGISRPFHVALGTVDLGGVSVGDKLRITAMDSYVVFVGTRADPDEREVQSVVLRPSSKQARTLPPQAVEVATRAENAQVVSVDPKLNTITIRQAGGGEPRTVPVGSNVNVSDLESGTNVKIRVTEATALVIEPEPAE